MAVKALQSPLVGAGIGGGASLATQAVLKFAVKDPTSDLVKSLVKWSGPVSLVVGAIPAAVLFFTKHKSAAIGAAIGDAIASAPAVVANVLAAKAATGTPELPAGTEAPKGFGAYLQARRAAAPINVTTGARGPVQIRGLPSSLSGFGNALPSPAKFGTPSVNLG